MPSNEFPLNFDDSRRARARSTEIKALGRNIGARLVGRAIGKPRIGKGRRSRGDRDIDVPTGGIPGTRTPTGSNFDPDRDGWVDEGTTRPRFIGVRNIPVRGKKPREASEEERTQRASKNRVVLSSGGSIAQWQKVGNQSGSNPGGFYKDENGNRHYVKWPQTPLHAENEVLANSLYELAGVSVPRMRVSSDAAGIPVVSSRIVDGRSIAIDNLTPSQSEVLRDGFLIDAWLGNWDAVLDGNIVANNQGEVMRIDFGGALLFRAKGGKKGVDGTVPFDERVSEIDILRDNRKAKAGDLFSSVSDSDLKKQARQFAMIDPDKIASVVDRTITDGKESRSLQKTLLDRRKAILDRFDVDDPYKDRMSTSKRLSSGGTPDDTKQRIRHRQSSYSYGDVSELDGREIRAHNRGWLRGMTSEQIANLVVPDSEEANAAISADRFFGDVAFTRGETIEQMATSFLLDQGVPQSQITPDRIKQAIQSLREGFVKFTLESRRKPESDGGSPKIDYSPEVIESLRRRVKEALDSNPGLKWAFEQFGAPPISIAESDQLNVMNRGVELARTSLSTGMIVTKKLIIDTLKAKRKRGDRRFTRYKGDFGDEFGDVLTHEYGHFLGASLDFYRSSAGSSRYFTAPGLGSLENPVFPQEHFDRSRFGESFSNRIAIDAAGRLHAVDEDTALGQMVIDEDEEASLRRMSRPFDKDAPGYGIASIYGHSSLAEMFAEGMVAVLDKDSEMEKGALTKMLSRDLRFALGISLDPDDRPWLDYSREEREFDIRNGLDKDREERGIATRRAILQGEQTGIDGLPKDYDFDRLASGAKNTYQNRRAEAEATIGDELRFESPYVDVLDPFSLPDGRNISRYRDDVTAARFQSWVIGGERIVFSNPRFGRSDGSFKRIPRSVPAITGLDIGSQDGFEMAQKWTAALYAVSKTDIDTTYADALMYAASRGDAEARALFEELASIGERFLKEDRKKSLDSIGVDESEIGRSPQSRGMTVDDLWVFHESAYEFSIDENGDLLLYPAGHWESYSQNGMRRPTIHTGLNHIVKPIMERTGERSRGVVAFKLADALESNPSTLEALGVNDTYFTPKPGEPLRIPKGKFRVHEYDASRDMEEQREELTQSLAKELPGFRPWDRHNVEDPGPTNLVAKIAKELNAPPSLHRDAHFGLDLTFRNSDIGNEEAGVLTVDPNADARLLPESEKIFNWSEPSIYQFPNYSPNARASLSAHGDWSAPRTLTGKEEGDGFGSRLFSGGTPRPKETPKNDIPQKPSYPRTPTLGAFIGDAEKVFGGARTWEEFWELYKGREVVFLDYETTGLVFDAYRRPSSNGKPTQIGAVKVRDGKIVARFNVFMNPGEPLGDWSRENLKDADGNPLTDEWLSTQISIDEAHRLFVEFAEDDAIIGVQNAAFDKRVLDDALRDSGIAWRPSGYLDTKEIADTTLPKWTPETNDGPFTVDKEGRKRPSNGLAAITEYLGVNLGSKHHTADADAEAAAEVMERIIKGAIERGWSTNVLDPVRRKDKMDEDNAKFNKDVQKFHADVAAYESSLASGRVHSEQARQLVYQVRDKMEELKEKYPDGISSAIEIIGRKRAEGGDGWNPGKVENREISSEEMEILSQVSSLGELLGEAIDLETTAVIDSIFGSVSEIDSELTSLSDQINELTKEINKFISNVMDIDDAIKGGLNWDSLTKLTQLVRERQKGNIGNSVDLRHMIVENIISHARLFSPFGDESLTPDERRRKALAAITDAEGNIDRAALGAVIAAFGHYNPDNPEPTVQIITKNGYEIPSYKPVYLLSPQDKDNLGDHIRIWNNNKIADSTNTEVPETVITTDESGIDKAGPRPFFWLNESGTDIYPGEMDRASESLDELRKLVRTQFTRMLTAAAYDSSLKDQLRTVGLFESNQDGTGLRLSDLIMELHVASLDFDPGQNKFIAKYKFVPKFRNPGIQKEWEESPYYPKILDWLDKYVEKMLSESDAETISDEELLLGYSQSQIDGFSPLQKEKYEQEKAELRSQMLKTRKNARSAFEILNSVAEQRFDLETLLDDVGGTLLAVLGNPRKAIKEKFQEGEAALRRYYESRTGQENEESEKARALKKELQDRTNSLLIEKINKIKSSLSESGVSDDLINEIMSGVGLTPEDVERWGQASRSFGSQKTFTERSGILKGVISRSVLANAGVAFATADDLQQRIDKDSEDMGDSQRAAVLSETASTIEFMPVALIDGSTGSYAPISPVAYGSDRGVGSRKLSLQILVDSSTERQSARNMGVVWDGKEEVQETRVKTIPVPEEPSKKRTWRSIQGHETWHGVTYANEWIRVLEHLEWARRAEKETVRTLSEIAVEKQERAGYEPYEVGVRDKWLNTYSGKIYESTSYQPVTALPFISTEIGTIGFQSIFFADQEMDKEHRHFFLGVLLAAQAMSEQGRAMKERRREGLTPDVVDYPIIGERGDRLSSGREKETYSPSEIDEIEDDGLDAPPIREETDGAKRLAKERYKKLQGDRVDMRNQFFTDTNLTDEQYQSRIDEIDDEMDRIRNAYPDIEESISMDVFAEGERQRMVRERTTGDAVDAALEITASLRDSDVRMPPVTEEMEQARKSFRSDSARAALRAAGEEILKTERTHEQKSKNRDGRDHTRRTEPGDSYFWGRIRGFFKKRQLSLDGKTTTLNEKDRELSRDERQVLSQIGRVGSQILEAIKRELDTRRRNLDKPDLSSDTRKAINAANDIRTNLVEPITKERFKRFKHAQKTVDRLVFGITRDPRSGERVMRLDLFQATVAVAKRLVKNNGREELGERKEEGERSGALSFSYVRTEPGSSLARLRVNGVDFDLHYDAETDLGGGPDGGYHSDVLRLMAIARSFLGVDSGDRSQPVLLRADQIDVPGAGTYQQRLEHIRNLSDDELYEMLKTRAWSRRREVLSPSDPRATQDIARILSPFLRTPSGVQDLPLNSKVEIRHNVTVEKNALTGENRHVSGLQIILRKPVRGSRKPNEIVATITDPEDARDFLRQLGPGAASFLNEREIKVLDDALAVLKKNADEYVRKTLYQKDSPFMEMGEQSRKKLLLDTVRQTVNSQSMKAATTRIDEPITEMLPDLQKNLADLDIPNDGSFRDVLEKLRELDNDVSRLITRDTELLKRTDRTKTVDVTPDERREIAINALKAIGVEFVDPETIGVTFRFGRGITMSPESLERAESLVRRALGNVPASLISGESRNGQGKIEVILSFEEFGRIRASAQLLNGSGTEGIVPVKINMPMIDDMQDGNFSIAWEDSATHEIGHGLEYANPDIRILEFLEFVSRAGNEELLDKDKVKPGSKRNTRSRLEKFIRDKWGYYYAGKWYGEGTGYKGRPEGTIFEILTTGLQAIFYGNKQADNRHLEFTLGLLGLSRLQQNPSRRAEKKELRLRDDIDELVNKQKQTAADSESLGSGRGSRTGTGSRKLKLVPMDDPRLAFLKEYLDEQLDPWKKEMIEKYDIGDGTKIYKASEYGDGYPPDLDSSKARIYVEVNGHRFVEFTDESGKNHLYYLRFENWDRVQAFDVEELEDMFQRPQSNDWDRGRTIRDFRSRFAGGRIVAATMDIQTPNKFRNYWQIFGVETKALPKNHRRRGLASAMLKFFRDTYPQLDIQHSKALSDLGRKFAEATDIDKITLASGRTGTGSKKLIAVPDDDPRLGGLRRRLQLATTRYKEIAPTDRKDVYTEPELAGFAPLFAEIAASNYARAHGHRVVEFDDGTEEKKLYLLTMVDHETVQIFDVAKLNEHYKKRQDLADELALPSLNRGDELPHSWDIPDALVGYMVVQKPWTNAALRRRNPGAVIDYESPTWTIDGIDVNPEHRRRGLASAALKLHRDIFPEANLQHSDNLTKHGRKFAEATDIEKITLASGGSVERPVAPDLVSPRAKTHIEVAKRLIEELQKEYADNPEGIAGELSDLYDDRNMSQRWGDYSLNEREARLLRLVNDVGAAINDAYNAELEQRQGDLGPEMMAVNKELEEIRAAERMLFKHLFARGQFSGKTVVGLKQNIFVPPWSNPVLTLTGDESIFMYTMMGSVIKAKTKDAIEKKIKLQQSLNLEPDVTSSAIPQATALAVFRALGIETVRPEDILPEQRGRIDRPDDKINIDVWKKERTGLGGVYPGSKPHKRIVKGVTEALLLIPRTLLFNDSNSHTPLNITYVLSKSRGHAEEKQDGVEITFGPSPIIKPDSTGVEYKEWKSGITHEIGHGIEFKNRWLRLMELLEWSDRAQGEALSTLKGRVPGIWYRADEMAVKDEWQLPYAGKIYESSYSAPLFEIVTTGLEDILYGWQPVPGRFEHTTDDRQRSFVFGVIAVSQQMQNQAPTERLSSGLVKNGSIDQTRVSAVSERVGKGLAKARNNNVSVETFDDIDSDNDSRRRIGNQILAEIDSMIQSVVDSYAKANNIPKKEADKLRASYRTRNWSSDKKLEQILEPLHTMRRGINDIVLSSAVQDTGTTPASNQAGKKHLFVARDGFGNLVGVAVVREKPSPQSRGFSLNLMSEDARRRRFPLGESGSYMIEYVGATNPGVPSERAGGVGTALFRNVLSRAAEDGVGLELYPADEYAGLYWDGLGFGYSSGESWEDENIDAHFFMEPQAVTALDKEVSSIEDRLSSGRDEQIKAHQSTNYSYGSTSVLTGKPMRAYTPGWLDGLSEKQIAKLIVPRNEEELIEMIVDEEIGRRAFSYGIQPEDMPDDEIADIERDIAEELSALYGDNPGFESSFETEEIDFAREVVTQALEDHPGLKWAMQKFGAPPFRMGQEEDGLDIPGETPQIPASHVENGGITIFPSFAYRLRESIDRSALPTRHSLLIDQSRSSSLLHEWAHWFDVQLKRLNKDGYGNQAFQPSHFDRSQFGEDTERDVALRTATMLRRNEELPTGEKIIDEATKAYENDTFDPSSEIPGTLTRYGNTSLREMFAEGVVAVLHPNPGVERTAITKGLSTVVRHALGFPVDQDQRPWPGDTNDRLSSGLVRLASGLVKEDGSLDTDELEKVSAGVRERAEAAKRAGFSVEVFSLRGMSDYKRAKISKQLLDALRDGPYGKYIQENIRDSYRRVMTGDDVLQREQLGIPQLRPEYSQLDKDVLRTDIAINVMTWALLDARSRSEDRNADYLIVAKNDKGEIVGLVSSRKDNDGRQIMNIGTNAAKSGVGSMLFSEIVQLAASEDEPLFLGALRSARTYWSSLGFSPSRIPGLEDQSFSIRRDAVQELASRLSSGEDNDYRGQHTAPGRDSGAPLHDMTSIYPDDIYGPDAKQFYGTGDELDDRALQLIASMRGKPNAQIRIYRAVPLTRSQTLKQLENDLAYVKRTGKIPKGQKYYYSSNPNRSEYYERLTEEIERVKKLLETEGDTPTRIRGGDWVSPFKEYAVEHGESMYKSPKNYRIVTRVVRASELFTAGDSWLEWGYDPEPKSGDEEPIRLSSGLVKSDGSLDEEAIDDVADRVSNRMYWLGAKQVEVDVTDLSTMSDDERAAFAISLADDTQNYERETHEDNALAASMISNAAQDARGPSYATTIIAARDRYGDVIGLMSLGGADVMDHVEIRYAGAAEQGSGVGSAMFAKAIEKASLQNLPIKLTSDWTADDFWESLGFVVELESGLHILPREVVRELDSRIKERSARLASGAKPHDDDPDFRDAERRIFYRWQRGEITEDEMNQEVGRLRDQWSTLRDQAPTRTAQSIKPEPKRASYPKLDSDGMWFKQSEMVPIALLKQMTGNPLNYDGEKLKKLSEDIVKNGLQNPGMITYSIKSKTAYLAEGNHRLAALEMAGFTHMPVRVFVDKSNEIQPFTGPGWQPHARPIPVKGLPEEFFDGPWNFIKPSQIMDWDEYEIEPNDPSARLASGVSPESVARDIQQLDAFEEATGVRLYGGHIAVNGKVIPTVRSQLIVTTKPNGDVQYYLEAFVPGKEENLHSLTVHTHSRTGNTFYGLALSKNARTSENLDTFDVGEFTKNIDKHLATAFEFPPSPDKGEWEIMSEQAAVAGFLDEWSRRGDLRSVSVQQYSPNSGFGEANNYLYDPVANTYVPSNYAYDKETGTYTERLASGASGDLSTEAKAILGTVGERRTQWRDAPSVENIDDAVILDAQDLVNKTLSVPVDPRLEQRAKELESELIALLKPELRSTEMGFEIRTMVSQVARGINLGKSQEELRNLALSQFEDKTGLYELFDSDGNSVRILDIKDPVTGEELAEEEILKKADKFISLAGRLSKVIQAMDKERMDASPSLALWAAHNSPGVRGTYSIFPDKGSSGELPSSGGFPVEAGVLKSAIVTQLADDMSALGVTDEDARRAIDLLGPIIGRSAEVIAEEYKELTGKEIWPVLLLADELIKQWARTSNDDAVPSIVAQLVARDIMPALTGLGDKYHRHEDVKKYGPEEWQTISNSDVLEIPKTTMSQSLELVKNPIIRKVFTAALQSQWARSQEQLVRHADANGNIRIYRGMGHEELQKEIFSQNPGHRVVRDITGEEILSASRELEPLESKAMKQSDRHNEISEEMNDINDEIDSFINEIEDAQQKLEEEEDEDAREELNSRIEDLLERLDSSSEKWDELQQQLMDIKSMLDKLGSEHSLVQSEVLKMIDEYDYERERDPHIKGRVNVQLFPLSSTSTSMGEAMNFGESGGNQVVIEADVPIRSIVSSTCTGYGCFIEDELVISHPIMEDVTAYAILREPGESDSGYDYVEGGSVSLGEPLEEAYELIEPNAKHDIGSRAGAGQNTRLASGSRALGGSRIKEAQQILLDASASGVEARDALINGVSGNIPSADAVRISKAIAQAGRVLVDEIDQRIDEELTRLGSTVTISEMKQHAASRGRESQLKKQLLKRTNAFGKKHGKELSDSIKNVLLTDDAISQGVTKLRELADSYLEMLSTVDDADATTEQLRALMNQIKNDEQLAREIIRYSFSGSSLGEFVTGKMQSGETYDHTIRDSFRRIGISPELPEYGDDSGIASVFQKIMLRGQQGIYASPEMRSNYPNLIAVVMPDAEPDSEKLGNVRAGKQKRDVSQAISTLRTAVVGSVGISILVDHFKTSASLSKIRSDSRKMTDAATELRDIEETSFIYLTKTQPHLGGSKIEDHVLADIRQRTVLDVLRESGVSLGITEEVRQTGTGLNPAGDEFMKLPQEQRRIIAGMFSEVSGLFPSSMWTGSGGHDNPNELSVTIDVSTAGGSGGDAYSQRKPNGEVLITMPQAPQPPDETEKNKTQLGRVRTVNGVWKNVFAHEVGHAMEEKNPWIRVAEHAYMGQRISKDESLIPLSELIGEGGHAGSAGFRDKWQHPYAGRVYRFGQIYSENNPGVPGLPFDNYEILSTGIEGLFFGNSYGADIDDDHMGFALGILLFAGTHQPPTRRANEESAITLSEQGRLPGLA